jgi:hypothetical protein
MLGISLDIDRHVFLLSPFPSALHACIFNYSNIEFSIQILKYLEDIYMKLQWPWIVPQSIKYIHKRGFKMNILHILGCF